MFAEAAVESGEDDMKESQTECALGKKEWTINIFQTNTQTKLSCVPSSVDYTLNLKRS